MVRSSTLREIVFARAGGACEYCRLLEIACGVTFHLEHVQPKSKGGLTIPTNLALSCPGCNLTKNERLEAVDESGLEQPLFNPRAYEPWLLGWHLHFILDSQSGMVLPRTAIGGATIKALAMNDHNRMFARNLQIRAGLIS